MVLAYMIWLATLLNGVPIGISRITTPNRLESIHKALKQGWKKYQGEATGLAGTKGFGFITEEVIQSMCFGGKKCRVFG